MGRLSVAIKVISAKRSIGWRDNLDRQIGTQVLNRVAEMTEAAPELGDEKNLLRGKTIVIRSFSMRHLSPGK